MTEKIEEIIKLIEKNSDPSTAYIDITIENDDYPRIVEGNSDGLQLLAAELLRRSLEIEKGYLITANVPDTKWKLDDHMPLSIIGITANRKQILENKVHERPIREKNSVLRNWGCFFALLVILSLLVLGAIYLVKLF